MPRGTENAHKHTHRSPWDKCLHVCLELKGIWMCTVIGAEAGSLLWVTHTQSPCHADTHTVIHTLAHKKGLRGNVRGKRAVMTLDFPILLQQCSFSTGAVQILTCKRAYKHTKLTYNLALNCRGKKKARSDRIRAKCAPQRWKGRIPPSHTTLSSPSLHPLPASLLPSSHH